MLVWSDGGAEYTVPEVRGWLFDAGFTVVTAAPLTSAITLAVGRKAA
jgi:8-O-methyltransferase